MDLGAHATTALPRPRLALGSGDADAHRDHDLLPRVLGLFLHSHPPSSPRPRLFSSPPPRVPLSPQPLSATSSSAVVGASLHARPRPTTLAAPLPVLDNFPSGPVLAGIGACSLRHGGGESEGGRRAKRLSQLGRSPPTKIPRDIIDEEMEMESSPAARHHNRCLPCCALGSTSRATPLIDKHVVRPHRLPDRQACHGSRHLQPPRFFGQQARDHASHYSVVVVPGASCLRVSLTSDYVRRDLPCPGSKQNQGIRSISHGCCRVGDLIVHKNLRFDTKSLTKGRSR